jgi:tol-pal system protein YbgF
LTVLALALPLVGQAEVPVIDGNTGYGNAPAPSYGTSGNYAVGGASVPTTAQGQLFSELQQMQSEISLLRGMLEEQQNEIQRLKQEGLERYQELDRRIAGGAVPAPQNSSAGGAIDAGAAPTPPAQPAAGGEADPAKEKLYYEAAFDLIKARDFDKANQALSAFLRRYPDSQYAGNAQYWLGEVQLVQGNLQEAGKAFALVAQRYPSHSKVPDSLYKLADVERKLGNADKARSMLQQLVNQFPGSTAAQLAQQELRR